MTLHILALKLMALQGLMGAFDTMYHHELTEALPRRNTARKELAIHACRSLLYSVLFIGLSGWIWGGYLSLIILCIFVIEIVLTLWDFVIEDQTRLLPATERITHTLLAINGGALTILLMLTLAEWWQQPTAFVWQPHGWLSVFLILCGIGVGLSGVRDAVASAGMQAALRNEPDREPVHFGDKSDTFLVTGGTGFVGSELIRLLLHAGHQVIVLTRRPKHAAWEFDGKVLCVSDLNNIPANINVNVVVHLAGARIIGVPWTNKRKEQLLESRTGVTEKVLAWIKQTETKPRLLLAASAIGYYGIQDLHDENSLNENSPAADIFMSRLCQACEHKALQARELGVQVHNMRFGLVLGNAGVLPMLMLPIKLGLGGSLGGGKQWISWIHIHDLIRGIAFLCSHTSENENTTNMNQAWNFTSPNVVTQKEFSQTAATLSHRPCFFPTPGLPFKLLLGEQSQLLLEGQKVIPQRLMDNGFKFKYESLVNALRNLLL